MEDKFFDAIGWIISALALFLNVADANIYLTGVISLLSIVWLILKIRNEVLERQIKKRKLDS